MSAGAVKPRGMRGIEMRAQGHSAGPPHPPRRRNGRVAGGTALAAAVLVAVAGCAGGNGAPAAPAPAPDAATSVSQVCGNLLGMDGVPAPEGGPDGPPPADAVRAYGAELAPLLDAALAGAPAELATSLETLRPSVEAARAEGTPPNVEDPAYLGAVTGYERWAHDNCGYQQVRLAGTDFDFTGAPETLQAGPASLLLENRSADGQFHVALLARAKDETVTLDRFLETPFEGLLEIVELVPGAAAAPPGQTGGVLVDLEPGRYFLLCPVGDEGQLPHHLQGMIKEITVT